MRFLRLCFFIALSLPALAQRPVAFGVKAGGMFNGSTVGFDREESRRYTLGPSIEFRLPRNFALEFNPLYKRAGYTNSSTDLLGSFYHYRVRYNVWEFPVLAKYYRGPFFVSGGYTGRYLPVSSAHGFEVIRDLAGRIIRAASGPVDSFSAESDSGLAAGGGLRLPLPRSLKFTAEYRYTRWLTVDQSRPRLGGLYGFQENQHEILIGLSF